MKRVFCALCLALWLPACSDMKLKLREPERDADGNTVEWKETAVTAFPAYPTAANAVQFEGGNMEEARFYLDKASISIGTDEVVRYTLMVLGDGGARTVSYEGIRCETREYRVYAYGRPNRTWVPPLESTWRPIQYQYLNNYRGVLFVNYLCKRSVHIPPLREMIAELERDAPAVNRRAPYKE
jgi:hypothetical protein